MDDKTIKLELTGSQALVLFDWISRSEDAPPVPDSSEQKVLWLLEAQLEKILVEPLEPNYSDLLARARRRVDQGS